MLKNNLQKLLFTGMIFFLLPIGAQSNNSTKAEDGIKPRPVSYGSEPAGSQPYQSQYGSEPAGSQPYQSRYGSQ
ncbi:MAG: hypothetical protein K2P93_09385 [Alphaproteobacteria bacterium]|nr:hypothetical protein [Alphaproteobacteria bacterium]